MEWSITCHLDPPTQLSDWNRLQLVGMPSTSNFAQETSYSPDVLNTAAQCYLLSLAPLQSAISLALKLELSTVALLGHAERHGFGQ